MRISFFSILIFPVYFFVPLCGQVGPMNIEIIPGSTKNDYLVTSVVFSGVNAAFTTMNIIRLRGSDPRRANAGFGIVTGIAQLVLPLMSVQHDPRNEDALTAMNAGIGLVTIGTSVFRLLKRSPAASGKITYDFYCSPLPGSRQAVTAGFRFNID